MVQPPLLGIVKQVVSGETIVIRERPVDGPPPEKTIVLSHISCGKLARRPSPDNPDCAVEEPFAWQAREFVRTKLVGKEVSYTIDKELPSGRLYGNVYLGKSVSGENIAVSLVEEGFAVLRRLNNAAAAEKNAVYQKLLAAEDSAKSAGKGRWSTQTGTLKPRNIIWSVDDPKALVDRHKDQRIRGIVEYVRDGGSMQLTLLPDEFGGLDSFYVVWMSLSGIKSPAIRVESGKQVPEQFALDAQFFVESRLLQRDVLVLLESCQNQGFIGSILHPNGNIAEVLLREGLARCIDWSLWLVSVPGAAEAYKSAERSAKMRHLRIWKDYQDGVLNEAASIRGSRKLAFGTVFTGQVVEVGNGDNLTVKCSDGFVLRIFLSSIRSPKLLPARIEEAGTTTDRARIRPLYDIPYAFEAREHLRAFIGKSVSVHVDYVQPKTATLPDERICCTVTCDSVNLAESLVSQGLASVIRYRNSTDSRCVTYAALLSAEEVAEAKGLGIHSKNAAPTHRVVELTNNLAKSRQFLPFLKRTPRFDAVVEFVVHASRVRVYLPRETCLLTLLLSGIQCPRRGGLKPDGTEEPDMPFSAEATALVKELCMQRNVEVAVENIDRVGNFIGWCFLETVTSESVPSAVPKSTRKKRKKVVPDADTATKNKVNLSVLLVSKGLATVHRAPATESSPYYHDLVRAEETAKAERHGLWSSDEFVQHWQDELNNPSNVCEEEVVGRLPGGIASGYVDDLSSLSLNGQINSDGPTQEEDKVQWTPAQVTAISRPGTGNEGLRFFAQHLSDSSTIVQISHSLNSQVPPLVPHYVPRKGETFAACFSSDDCWYRARIVKQDAKSITVHFIDFGNEETVKLVDVPTRLAPLVAGNLVSIPPQAREYRLAFVQLPPDASDRLFVERTFADVVMNKEILLTVRFDSIPCANETVKPVPAVSLRVPPSGGGGAPTGSASSSGWVDVVQLLLEDGLACVEPMRPQLLKKVPQSVLSLYLECQSKAKKERKNIWRYGDFRVDNNA